ncbi:hypothetical protein CDV36_011916 [Fusarium kuroshium]|uniref:Major facilitator superfamily (MFS) profile domain-containing protein n=1 Tax=Fusarium kuroshium TaxID=2010991 RepID=A0A3M2RT99_9HYPO|nr:hypothetical protein CDV36_011916 [Fusarium kuroshium]
MTPPSLSTLELDSNHVSSLPPADGGRDAWKFLIASFIVEAVLWGFPLAFGVFQDYYPRLPQFQDDPNIVVIGTRHFVVAGWAVCVLSLLAASFANSVPTLIATQGFLYGLGFTTLYFPVLSMLNEWFISRRGLAFGVLSAGAGLSGGVLPFLLELSLHKYGYKTTLRATAVAQFVLVAPILPLLKPRLPPSIQTQLPAMDFKFLSHPLFYCFALSNLIHGFSYYVPSLYLPSYASLLGYSWATRALILSANSLASIFGQIGFGFLSDRTHNIFILIFISAFTSALTAFFLWGYAKSLGLLLAFSIMYGWFAGAYVVFWPKFGSILSEDPQLVYSLMAFGKGIGNIVTGPITTHLLSRPVTSGYGMGKYEPLILYLGISMLCSSLGILGWAL